MSSNAVDYAFAPDGRLRPPAPVPRDLPLPLLLLRTVTRPLEALPRAAFTDRWYRLPGPLSPWFLTDPAAIRAVLVDQADAFDQGALFRRMLAPVWGRGVATAQGSAWRWQRHAAAGSFRPAGLGALVPAMRAPAEAALARWRQAGAAAVIDMSAEAARITFEVILDTVLSGGEDFDRDGMRVRIAAFFRHLSRFRLSYWLAPDAHHEGRVAPAGRHAGPLRADVDRMIRRRRDAPPRGDLLGLLLAATDPETGRAMDDETLRDNLLGFIFAGHGTSAETLGWALFLISAHPPTAERVRAEVEAVTGGAPVGSEHIAKLVFTKAVISETLRLYPPAYMLTRVVVRDTSVEGVAVKAGKRIAVPIYALHRNERLWSDPHLFDPDRFGPDAPVHDRFAYLPFGAGPRICLGAAFATTELTAVLATLVRGARFTMEPGHRVWPEAGIALSPRGGLPMRIEVDA